MTRLPSIFILLLSLTGCTHRSSPLDSWKEYRIPQDANTLHVYNNSNENWYVFLKDGEIQAAKGDNGKDDTLPFKINEREIYRWIDYRQRLNVKVDDGYLVEFNAGEWGGDIFWFSPDGKNKYKISGDHVVQFVTHGKNIYAVEGYNSSIDDGFIFSIKKIANKWVSLKYLRFSAPAYRAGFDSKGNFIIITSTSLLLVNPELKVTPLINKGFWANYLNPNSLVIKDNIVYIGMRVGIFEFNLSTYKQTWLMPG